MNTNESHENNSIINSMIARIEQIERMLEEMTKVTKDSKSEIKYLNVRDASRFLGMSRSNLYILMRDGKISYTLIGRQRRIMKADIINYIKKNYNQEKKSIL
jgi:excisionase family DNA binding protein